MKGKIGEISFEIADYFGKLINISNERKSLIHKTRHHWYFDNRALSEGVALRMVVCCLNMEALKNLKKTTGKRNI